jgi:hypothetical protein
MLPFFLLEQESQLKTSQLYLFYSKQNPSIDWETLHYQNQNSATKPVLPPSKAKQKAHPPGTTKPFIICVLCGADAGINDRHSAVPALLSFRSRKIK